MNKKKGHTLIEITLSICLMEIIAAALIYLYIYSIRDYGRSTKENIDYFYANEAFRYLEEQVNASTELVDVYDNSMYIKKYNPLLPFTIKELQIAKEENRLTVLYKENGYTKATNNILKSVEQFTVVKKNHMLKISVKLNKGRIYEKCILIE